MTPLSVTGFRPPIMRMTVAEFGFSRTSACSKRVWSRTCPGQSDRRRHVSAITSDETLAIAAGGDKPVDDLGLDRVGDRVGGRGRCGIVAVVDELDRVAEAGRIAARRRAERRGLGLGRNDRLEFGRRLDVAGLRGAVRVVHPIDEQIGDRIGIGHDRSGRVDALWIEPRQRDVGQGVERRFLGRRGAHDRGDCHALRRRRKASTGAGPVRCGAFGEFGCWRLQHHPSLSDRVTEIRTESARFRADLILP